VARVLTSIVMKLLVLGSATRCSTAGGGRRRAAVRNVETNFLKAAILHFFKKYISSSKKKSARIKNIKKNHNIMDFFSNSQQDLCIEID
jgi:hypothetical protein